MHGRARKGEYKKGSQETFFKIISSDNSVSVSNKLKCKNGPTRSEVDNSFWLGSTSGQRGPV